VSLKVNGIVVYTADFRGEVTYTIPEDGAYGFWWSVDAGNATWVLGCDPAPDTDGDGVADTDDECPDTELPETTQAKKKNRYVANADGQFVGVVDGQPLGISVADTGGCSGEQIIEAAGLG
jgi:hypothetical protein